MSSGKRYKQPSENSRFQDIPPRFKRQKSFTSHKLQSAMENTNQNTHPSQRTKKPLSDAFASNGNTPLHQKGSQYPKEGRKIVKKLSTQKAQQNAEKSLLMKPTSTQPFVLSPMENKLFSLVRNDEHDTQSDFPVTHNQNSIPYSQQAQSHAFTNANSIPHSSIPTRTDPYGWVEQSQTTNQYLSTNRFSPSPSIHRNSPVNNTCSNSSKVNYSDPDIRTIEMLRELERVAADQTDVVSNETSNDKNSLVSHHLRMLMCAVDRYTEGVEDQMDSDGCEDEALPLPSPQNNHNHRHIPSPPQVHIKDVSNYNTYNYNQDFSDNDSAYSEDSISPIKPVAMDNFTMAPNANILNTWNPWATPSFNALDVYATSSPNTNANNVRNAYYPSHPPMFMFDYSNQARNCF